MRRLKLHIKRQISVSGLCRSLKLDLREHTRFLREGEWRIESRFAYHVSAEGHHLTKLFGSIVRPDFMQGRSVCRLCNAVLGYSRARIQEGPKEIKASILYRSRGGKLKFFDVDSGQVYSQATESEWREKDRGHACRLFQYFGRPSAKFLRISGREFIVEELLQAGDLTALTPGERGAVFQKLINRYGEYVTREGFGAGGGSPAIAVFDEVSGKASRGGCPELESHRKAYEEFAPRLRYVEAHLDFNIANILFDGSFYLLDSDDAGLVLPAFYDVLNVAFNQINYWRDMEWFELLLSREVRPSLVAFCRVCVEGFREEELHLVFLVYFVFLNSRVVRTKLGLAEKSPSQLWEAFRVFSEVLRSSQAGV